MTGRMHVEAAGPSLSRALGGLDWLVWLNGGVCVRASRSADFGGREMEMSLE